MSNVFRSWSVRSALVCLFTCFAAIAAQAQDSAPPKPLTPLQRQLEQFDLGLLGAGQITSRVHGTVTSVGQFPPGTNPGFPQSVDASTTVGLLATLRYTRSPLIGAEINFTQARYTENYSAIITGGAQTKANEYSAGYVAHTPTLFTLRPFVGGGLGAMAFHPTANGGLGLPKQYRFAYYYDLGVDQPVLSDNFGLRLQFRQVFYTAPDFLQNYLTINKWTSTLEPSIGFYLKF